MALIEGFGNRHRHRLADEPPVSNQAPIARIR